MSSVYARVIVNPYAGTGATGRKWPAIENEMSRAGLSFDVVQTEGKGHAMKLARESALAGYSMVVAAGGDGTLNEVVNGLMDSGRNRDVILGIFNTGTGCDMARFLGIPRDYRQSCLRLINPSTMFADVGLAEYHLDDREVRRYFISTASLGLDGEVVATAEKLPRILHGVTPYFMGTIEALGTYRNKDIRLCLDNSAEDIRICSMIIANGGYYASGMKVAPEADFKDGLFEVVIVGDINKFELIQTFSRGYLGTHIKHPKIRLEKAAEVRVTSAERILIQADGELLGEGPARFSIVPAALNIAL